MWGEARPLFTLTEDAAVWFPNGVPGGLIWFSGELPGQLGKSDLFVVDTGKAGATPEALPPPLNTPHIEWDPYVSNDGSTLVFISDRPGGFGRTDVWISRRQGEGWGEPVNAGPDINTGANEVAATLSPDGSIIYFVREPSRPFWARMPKAP